MNIVILGGAGFIGTNLAIRLAKKNDVTVIDRGNYFEALKKTNLPITYKIYPYELSADFDAQVRNQDIVFHLASTNIPGDSNKNIAKELEANVTVTALLLDACVRQHVKEVVFISSGGAVYGKKGRCPISEDTVTYPITSYGIEKISIEKLLYLYRYQYGLDYRTIRLANPYGPYQRPNGKLGVVTTFIYKALKSETLEVYGDGSVVRDFIYIDDAVEGILKIAFGNNEYRVFNLGSGKGTSIQKVIQIIKEEINDKIKIKYISCRKNDVQENYLDISRYENSYGKMAFVDLKTGILKTSDFIKKNYI